MAFVKVYIHFIWSTKNRHPYLNSPELRKQVWIHMKENATKHKIYIDTINGYREHCHCLLSLGVQVTIAKVIQLIKGESSWWINKNHLTKSQFEWQDEYFGVSVSESDLPRVRKYIRSQEEHHKHVSFEEEYDDFLKKCGLERLKDGSILPKPTDSDEAENNDGNENVPRG